MPPSYQVTYMQLLTLAVPACFDLIATTLSMVRPTPTRLLGTPTNRSIKRLTY